MPRISLDYDGNERDRKRRERDAHAATGPCQHKESKTVEGNKIRCKCGKVVGFLKVPTR